MGFKDFQQSFSVRVQFLRFISGLYSRSSLLSETTEARTLHLVFLYVRWLLQMMLFIEYSSDQSTALDEWFWFILTFTRPDSLLSNLQAAYIWFLLVCFGVLLCWVLFLLLFTLDCTGHGDCRLARMLLLAITNSLVFAMTIPCSNALLTVYFDNDTRFGNGFSADIRAWGRIFAPPLYVLNLVYITIVYVGNYEFDQFEANKMSKNDLTQDYMFILLTQVTIWSYYLFASSHYYIHLFIVGATSFLSTYRVYVHLPFYGLAYNMMFVWSRGALGLSCLGFFVSFWLDSPLCGLILTFTVTIGWFFLVKLWFEGHYKSTLKTYSKRLDENIDDYEWELGLRRYFSLVYSHKSNSETLLSTLNSALHSPNRHNKARILLFKHFFMLHVLEDERGARICLSLAALYQVGNEDMYLILKYERDISQKSHLEEVLYFNYLEEILKLKEMDKQLCEMLGKIWKELGSAKPETAKITILAYKSKKKIQKVEENFGKLSRMFQTSSELMCFYSEFREHICGDLDQAKYWKAKSTVLARDKKYSRDDSLSFFDDSTCVVLVDMRISSLGVISYMNSSAAMALAYDTLSSVTSKITGVIPSPYNCFHSKCIPRFLSSGASFEIQHPDMLPLVNSKGYLIFTCARLFFTCYHNQPLISLVFKPLQHLHEGAMLTDSFVIEHHTQGLPLMLMGNEECVIKAKSLEDLRPNFAQKREADGNSRPFPLFSNRSYLGKFAWLPFGNQRVYFFFLFTSGKFHLRCRVYELESAAVE